MNRTIETRSPFLGIDQEQISKIIPNSDYREISDKPYKILDAPGLEDDFYLNLLDWSSKNDLVVGLRQNVYIWSATTGQVKKLCDYSDELVCSVKWNN